MGKTVRFAIKANADRKRFIEQRIAEIACELERYADELKCGIDISANYYTAWDGKPCVSNTVFLHPFDTKINDSYCRQFNPKKAVEQQILSTRYYTLYERD